MSIAYIRSMYRAEKYDSEDDGPREIAEESGKYVGGMGG